MGQKLLPDFLLIGAMKCGTTSLAAQLAAQDGLFITTPKEPNYFSDDAVYAQGPEWYGALFAAAEAGDLRGEASTHYTKLPTYPQTVARMAAALEAPRLIYMIRNPLERAVSHYIHEWSTGRMGPDPVAAFKSNPELVDYGRYAMQIAPFIDAFGTEACCLTSLEAIKARPDSELARICAHIGLPHAPVWQQDMKPQNVSAQRVRPLPGQWLLVDNPVATLLRRRLVPKSLRSRIRKSRSMSKRPELPAALIQELQARFTEDHAILTGQFPDHPALRDCYPFLRDA